MSQWTRRDFLEVLGAGAAGMVAGPLGATATAASNLEDWKKTLLESGAARSYLSSQHLDARLPLGGIGTGNFEIGPDGRFATWQLFNTLRDGSVPFHFALRVGQTARLLQTSGGPDAPGVKAIQMSGEYPRAVLRYLDPALPVEVEMTAFSPFAPLDERVSSLPLAAFLFRLRNPGAAPVTADLAGLLQNPVGYDAFGEPEGPIHPNFGGNVNEPLSEGAAQGILFRANPVEAFRLDRPLHLYASQNLAALREPPADAPGGLSVDLLDQLPARPGAGDGADRVVIWLEEAGAELPATLLDSVREWVHAGGTLVLAGVVQPLIARYASASRGMPLPEGRGRPPILFEDFEHGYSQWRLEGTAFGERPASGTLPNQQPVSGFVGHGLVNTYLHGDGTTGKLISKEFTIQRDYIQFLIGGGAHPDTQLRLVVDGQTVRASSGKNQERLEPAAWDVRDYTGRLAHLEIVDLNTGGWGHINVDQIEFSDQPPEVAVLRLIEELLPVSLGGVRTVEGTREKAGRAIEFDALAQKTGTIAGSLPTGLGFWKRSLGRGSAVLVAGSLIDIPLAASTGRRQRAYTQLCRLAGAACPDAVGVVPGAPGFGHLVLAALHSATTIRCDFPDIVAAWKAFADQGQFMVLAQATASTPSPSGQTVTGAVAVHLEIPAGGSVEVPFLLAWHFPNKYSGPTPVGCHYATEWESARRVVRAATEQFAEWRRRTERFVETFYNSKLPYWLLDCLTSQAATIRHIGVVFRIANGDTYGWEGSNGCCQPTCTHVWGYEQTLARLFPALERDMRRIDFTHQQRPDGGINNRTDVPSPPQPSGEMPFADGHASCVLKAWREALNQSEDRWLRDYWPRVKRAVEYLISRDAATSGGKPDGTLSDDQWNTYDEALHGVTTFIGTYYLAALRAGEEWAKRVGDSAAAARFRGVFEQGQRKLDQLCWNGEYYQQHLPDYAQRSGEVGPGCMADQLIGQWWAHQLGLGYLLPPERVKAALQAVFRYNWKSDLTGWKHAPRAFAGAGDRGLIICTWPKGGRPGNVMLYSDEVWTGIEYQVAAHMVYEGMIEEGLMVAKAARDRYDGIPRPPIPRNPWNEIECGGHYARAMSSWSLLLAISGYHYDGPHARLLFSPRQAANDFRAFICGPEGWGQLRQQQVGTARFSEVQVVEGRLPVRELRLSATRAPNAVRVTLAGQVVAAKLRLAGELVEVAFDSLLVLQAGQSLRVELA